ncbi:amino acid/polyamine/organocation transporter (APC superfamily) [Pseudonocardia hierapolitana]|uniref:Amino acid/polyamine/organocation transporter (APC superfamily) n=1 Tax=Pseudonocardia hierapolitana TaxID=1128676 RepID=A0A561T4B0_9PSEU|nr:APC family permease [Pseudonocardia hierapolitana]TWF81948.1 amino acid/polyamine/organocation transporter (APC superfamily) [Pseudonocardia hierapolitana]
MAENTHLDRVLGMPSIVLFGLAYLVPLTVFTTYGVVTELTSGHLPAAYVVTLTAMLFTAYSYGLMVRAHPFAGSAYTYTQRSFGPHLGFMTGWALLLDYLFLPMINYLVMGIYLEAAFPGVPVAVWIIGAILLVTGLNVLGIRLVARMNFVLVAIQVVFIVVFLVAVARTTAGTGMPSLAEPFLPDGGEASAVLGGAAILCLSFLGFDAVSTLSEETRDPRRRIPRAIMLVTLIGGALFIVVSYAGHLVFPRYSEFTDVDSAALDVVGAAGGAALTAFFTAAYIAGCFGSAMASQASVSRILYAMGRDGALPAAVFGRLHRRFHTPALATAVVGVLSLIALVISLELASSMISFGALVAFSLVNLSVVKHYVIDEGRRTPANLIAYAVVPGIGVLLTLWLWTSLSGTTFVVGLAWIAAGLVYLAGLTRMFTRRPPELRLSEAELAA